MGNGKDDDFLEFFNFMEFYDAFFPKKDDNRNIFGQNRQNFDMMNYLSDDDDDDDEEEEEEDRYTEYLDAKRYMEPSQLCILFPEEFADDPDFDDDEDDDDDDDDDDDEDDDYDDEDYDEDDDEDDE